MLCCWFYVVFYYKSYIQSTPSITYSITECNLHCTMVYCLPLQISSHYVIHLIYYIHLDRLFTKHRRWVNIWTCTGSLYYLPTNHHWLTLWFTYQLSPAQSMIYLPTITGSVYHLPTNYHWLSLSFAYQLSLLSFTHSHSYSVLRFSRGLIFCFICTGNSHLVVQGWRLC